MPIRSPVQSLLEEIHGRSVWQVMGLYLGGAWGVLEVVDQFVDRLILPDRVYGAALTLLAIGLPVMVATAYFEGGRAKRRSAAAGGDSRTDGNEPPVARNEALTDGNDALTDGNDARTDGNDARSDGNDARSDGNDARSDGNDARPAGNATAPPANGGAGIRRLFTWRNAILGGVGAFALLGMASTGFYASRSFGVGFAAPLIARGVLEERELLLLADFENRTPDSLLARAVTEALRVDLTQSDAVRLVEPAVVRQALERMERDPDLPLGEDAARELARREGIKAYLVGAVDRLGSSYVVSSRLVGTATGAELAAVRKSAPAGDDVIEAVDALSRELRTRVGESLGGVNRSPPLPQVTTASLEALEAFSAGLEASRRGDRPAAIRWFEEAVRIDTAFASAYRGLAVEQGNLGDLVRAEHYSALARRHAARLPLQERYLSAAHYHASRDQRDSAVHYYRLLLDVEPENYVALNNLGDQYEWMGRYEEALELYRRAGELEPDRSVTRVNLASAARSLGDHVLADSAVRAMIEGGNSPQAYLPQLGANAIYAGRWDVLDSLATASEAGDEPFIEPVADLWRAASDAKAGRLTDAMASLHSTAVDAEKEGVDAFALLLRDGLAAAAAAGGDPGRALPYLEEWDVSRLAGSAFFRQALGSLAASYGRAARRAEAERLLAEADSLTRAEGLSAPGTVLHARAVLALGAGYPEEAIAQVDRAVAADFGLVRHEYRLTRAQAYEALGRFPEAAAEYAALTSSRRLFWLDFLRYPVLLPLAHERAASAYLAAGDTVRALGHMAAFVELWQDPDPELRHRVEAARARMNAILRARG